VHLFSTNKTTTTLCASTSQWTAEAPRTTEKFMQIKSVSVEIGGRTMTLETGVMAKQADGAVVVRQDDSSVLVTAVTGGPARFDFMPLTCDYQDRNGAYGTIPGNYFKREGRSNERETLVSRMIDRPIRPQFPKHYRNETQVIATVLSYDETSDTDVLAITGASAALHISDAPLSRPIAAVRVSQVDGAFVVNPSRVQMETASMNLIVAGTTEAVCMVEGGAMEISEAEMMDGMDLAHSEIKKIIGAMNELRELAGVEKAAVAPATQLDADVVAFVTEHGSDSCRVSMGTQGKFERKAALKAARNAVIAKLTEGKDEDETARLTGEAKGAWDKLLGQVMRKQVLSERKRIDGRATDEIRFVDSKVSISERAHGSALFTRGETQTMVTVALGMEMDSQRIDYAGEQSQFRRWMLTYNFPPFCVGEARMLRGPKRREIGHGKLSWRALLAVLPSQEDFPYVVRACSDVLESNGSSSMASVCGATLALMDAGVPLKAPVAGIAMGLIKQGDDFAVLSDILGDEDHLGDMDFKVTGTKDGITAFQMDTKIDSVSREIMGKALSQAREGRIHILDEMAKAISESRTEMSPYAPRITTLQIKADKIRDIIGPGGRTIRGMQETCGVKITVEDDGTVLIASNNQEATDKALGMIREMTQEAELGKLYLGVVKRCVDFGAFIEIFPGTEGLVHISHLATERVERTTDVVSEGDEVLVRVIEIDRRSGKIRLSRKEALEAAM
jgi:polyribonucleotide nucleotidyltransferase